MSNANLKHTNGNEQKDVSLVANKLIAKLVNKLFIFGVLIVINLSSQATESLPVITVWNYYLSPPFLLDDDTGLASDFVNQMNNRLGKDYQFELVSLPRVRLNQQLADGKQGMVLFSHWLWLEEQPKNKYLWSPALIKDQNLIVSLRRKNFQYSGPESLRGLRFGAIRGRKYYSLETLLNNNELLPVYLNRERQALQMLLAERIDVTSQPASLVSYLIKEMAIEKDIALAEKPLFTINRHIMLTSKMKQLYKELLPQLIMLKQDPLWQASLKKYHLTSADKIAFLINLGIKGACTKSVNNTMA